jgi:hypothetical protein
MFMILWFIFDNIIFGCSGTIASTSSMQHIGQYNVAVWVGSAMEEQKLDNTDPF